MHSSLNRWLQEAVSCHDNPDHSPVTHLAEKSVVSLGTLYQQEGAVFLVGVRKGPWEVWKHAVKWMGDFSL